MPLDVSGKDLGGWRIVATDLPNKFLCDGQCPAIGDIRIGGQDGGEFLAEKGPVWPEFATDRRQLCIKSFQEIADHNRFPSFTSAVTASPSRSTFLLGNEQPLEQIVMLTQFAATCILRQVVVFQQSDRALRKRNGFVDGLFPAF